MSLGCKGYSPLETMTNGYKKVNFTELLNKIYILLSTISYSWENLMELASLQPSVTDVKGKNILHNHNSWLRRIFFATVTDSCKEASFMGFCHYI